ncbi:spore germination protein (amino acid permease) [Orenia metallireducens]|uniref:Spore germination protein (Amino acid permease) n=1 Tax=Orenia metallireducens TaxID=1413210 RepID=A0A285GU55_9FIRM|nr:endospore germination permease [Orenia metallireducens]PRX25254.1 spore germination protein (amino acid permease) [Orenia metallireducens]SNY26988.1 spore germination protein (amino acid permease) [Orenia metallireducens]
MSRELESINICSFIIHGMISIRLLSIPRAIVEYAENDSWISVLIMGGYALLIGYLFYWLGLRYKSLTFSQICEKVYGKFFGKIIILGIAIYTIISFSLGIRLFTDGIRIFLLDTTPIIFIITIMILACLYCLLKGVRTISIILDMLLPLILAFILLLVFLSLKNVKFIHLRPFFYGGVKPILQGAREMADPFLTVGIIGYVLPYFKNFKKMKKWIAISVSISVAVYTIILLLCIMAFGSTEIKYLIFPTITLSKSIMLESNILERAESLYMAAWIPITFSTLLLFYLASTLNLKAFFNTKKDRVIIFSQVPLFLVLALYPDNISEVFYLIGWNEDLGQLLIFLIVPLTAMIEFFKERRKNLK